MKPATQEQIDHWIAACVEYARVGLPSDHPQHNRIGNPFLAEVRRKARDAASKPRARGLYDAADIRKRAEGDVDMAAVRAANAAAEERWQLALAVRDATANATTEQLRAALAVLAPCAATAE